VELGARDKTVIARAAGVNNVGRKITFNGKAKIVLGDGSGRTTLNFDSTAASHDGGLCVFERQVKAVEAELNTEKRAAFNAFAEIADHVAKRAHMAEDPPPLQLHSPSVTPLGNKQTTKNLEAFEQHWIICKRDGQVFSKHLTFFLQSTGKTVSDATSSEKALRSLGILDCARLGQVADTECHMLH